MAFSASRILIPRLTWSLEALDGKGAPEGILRSCESVLEALSQFAILEVSSGPLHSIDVDMVSIEVGITLFAGFFGIDINTTRMEFFALFQDLQGFIFSLKSPMLKDRKQIDIQGSSEISSLSAWESSFMSYRTQRIKTRARAMRCRDNASFTRLIEWPTRNAPRNPSSKPERRENSKKIRISQRHERTTPGKLVVRLRKLSATGSKGRFLSE